MLHQSIHKQSQDSCSVYNKQGSDKSSCRSMSRTILETHLILQKSRVLTGKPIYEQWTFPRLVPQKVTRSTPKATESQRALPNHRHQPAYLAEGQQQCTCFSQIPRSREADATRESSWVICSIKKS